MDFRNKLECLSQASLSSLIVCLWVKSGAYPRVEHLKGLTCKLETRLERLAMEKHSSLLQKSVNLGRNKFYDTGPSLRKYFFLIFVTLSPSLKNLFWYFLAPSANFSSCNQTYCLEMNKWLFYHCATTVGTVPLLQKLKTKTFLKFSHTQARSSFTL